MMLSARSWRDRSLDLEFYRRLLPAIALDLILDRLSLIQRAQARLLNGGYVDGKLRPQDKKKERSGLQSACDELTDKGAIHHR